MKARKIIKYSFLSVAAGLLLVLASGVVFTHFYKTEIINFFLKKANERLEAPVNVARIDVSFLKNFPDVSIILDEITIPSPGNFEAPRLASVESGQFTLNPIKIMKGDYEVEDFILEQGEIFLEINELGENNYQIVRKRKAGNTGFKGVVQLILKQVKINYADRRSDKVIAFDAENAKAKIKYENKKYDAKVDGDFHVNYITVNDLDYFKNKKTKIKALLFIDDENKIVDIQSSDIAIGNGDFAVSGQVAYSDNTRVDLQVEGVNTNAQTLISILPEKYSNYLRGYKSRGEIYFNGAVAGEFTAETLPNSRLNFGARNASFFHPDYEKHFEKIFLTGSFESGIYRDLSRAKLTLKNASVVLDDRRVKGEFEVRNFKDPFVKSAIEGKINLNSLVKSFPESRIRNAYGEMYVDVSFSGRPKSGQSINSFSANGEIQLKEVSFILKGERLPFNHFNGSFIFRENDLAISDFSGEVGQSDFLINGFFKNVSGFIDKGGKTIEIEADLVSRHLDFDELLKSNFASQDTVRNGNHPYSFNISPDIALDFNCRVKNLKLKRFTGSNISGNLRVKDQIAILNDVSLSTMGGKIALSGSVNNKVSSIVQILCEANLGKIYIDSVFYVFDNFDQRWLKDENLRGQLNADVNTYILLDNHLKFYSRDFKADISASILNGELLDFEPMQKLSKFVEEKSLAHLRFSEMRNNIRIENKTIYIPEMLVSSSVSNIRISGAHTFNQQIDYHVAVPLKNFLRVRKLSNREIEASTSGTHLLLKIEGTTDDYAIKYDTKALKQKLAEDIKEEGRELKQIFKEKGRDEEVVEVEEGEYFDF